MESKSNFSTFVFTREGTRKRHNVGYAPQQKTMRNAMTAQYCCGKMVRITRFTAVRSENESVEASLLAPDVQGRHIRKEIVNPVAVGWVLLRIPHVRKRNFV